ncbi:hypothetical protein WMO40_20810 [Bacillaceae bacterium CLA-AA-H227]|uniref:Uncharacterized protein n=2 Tax=Robertmurraya TaxID=2837507 RepID=A0A4U1CYU2_9BACI|nr:hypothetical protein [Robertmurraya kyonggiensis]TKC15195.1 hypothetical protein FA727_20145 [Robertmurraya kyonggiensis]
MGVFLYSFWGICIVLIIAGLLAYYIITGETPSELWQAASDTTAGTMLTIIFGAVILIAMITLAIKVTSPPRR